MSAAGREELREHGEDLRHLGQRVFELSERVGLLAQSYRDLYEGLRLLQRPTEPGGAESVGGGAAPRPIRARRASRTRAAPAPEDPLAPRPLADAGDDLRRKLRSLLEEQGEIGARLRELSRHPLLAAGGEEPRRIRVRLSEVGERCLNLRLSSDSLSRGTPRAVAGLLDDLCELNSETTEELVRFGQGLRLRGDGILAGKKQDVRYLQGDAWRRTP